MNIIFIIISIVLLLYITFRRIDYFTIGVVVFLIYHSYCSIGFVFITSNIGKNVPLYYDFISNRVYYIIYSQQIILLLSMIYYDYKDRKKQLGVTILKKRDLNEEGIYNSFLLLGIISLALLLIEVIKIGPSNLSADKSEIWDKVSLFYIFSQWAAMAIFAYSIDKKKHHLLLFSLPQIFIHLFIGSRAYFAAVAIVFLLLKLKRRNNSWLTNLKFYSAGAIGAFIILVYKKIFRAVKELDFGSIVAILSQKETYIWALQVPEARVVLANLNFIINSKFQLENMDVLARLVSFIPGANSLITAPNGLTLSSYIIKHHNATYGLASSIWAEGYAMFGYFGIYIFFLLWIRILRHGNKILFSSRWLSYFLIPLISYYSYYIHRMDFTKVLGNMKILFTVIIAWWIINAFLTKNLTIYSKK